MQSRGSPSRLSTPGGRVYDTTIAEQTDNAVDCSHWLAIRPNTLEGMSLGQWLNSVGDSGSQLDKWIFGLARG